MTRAEQTQENRAAILRAARDHFSAHGYHGASVDAIAEAAGFSKGAIYSQFGSKDDLMLAVLESSIDERHRATIAKLDQLGEGQWSDDVIRFAYAASKDALGWQTALIEFRIHAARDQSINDRYRALHARTVERVAQALGIALRRSGRRPPDDLHAVATAFLTGGTGLVVELLVDPQYDPIDFVDGILAVAPATARAPGGTRSAPPRD